MSLIDLIRMDLGTFTTFILVVCGSLIVAVIVHYKMKYYKEQKLFSGSLVALAVIVAITYGIYLGNLALTNSTPRSTIDRSQIEQQIGDFNK